MASEGANEIRGAGFNNPFEEDDSPPDEAGDVSPRRTRSIAEDVALQEEIAPEHKEPLSEQSPVREKFAETPARVKFNAVQDMNDSNDDILKRSSDSNSIADTPTRNDSDKADGTIEKIKTTAERVANKMHLSDVRVTGPSRLFNPTNVRANVKWSAGRGAESDREGGSGSNYDLLWRARDNRKGRGSIAVRSAAFDQGPGKRETIKQSWVVAKSKEIAKGVKRMFTTFPYWDMAFWSGWTYTIGASLFIIDGAFAWTPAAFPDSEFEGEETYGVPLCFFFGACFFQIGAVVAYLEAINDGSFHGSAMRRLMEGHEEDQKKMLDEKIQSFFGHMVHRHHEDSDQEAAERQADRVDPEAGWRARDRKERPGSVYPPSKHPGHRRGALDFGEAEEGQGSTYLTWRWWPSWHALRTHHVYEIGYIACTIQLFGVTLYGVTSVIILPGILDSFSNKQALAGYWIPQMVAAACFLIASILFTLETQEKWWKPEVRVLGWWIGVWSIVGSVGFELCASFGPTSETQDWALYQSNLSSMWGSVGYTIGSFLQWYEAVNKHPVQEMFDEPGEMKTWEVHPL